MRGKDVSRYQINWNKKWLIDTHNGYGGGEVPPIDINNYKAIKRHLDKFYPSLKNRQDKGITPYNLRNCAYHEEFEHDKIVYSNMTQDLSFVYDRDGFYTNQKCFIITGRDNLKYLTGYFNSKISAIWVRSNCPKLGNDGIELSKVFFENIPVPIPDKKQEERIISLVDDLISAQQKPVDRDRDGRIRKTEEEINMIFYLLYGLTKEEIFFLDIPGAYSS